MLFLGEKRRVFPMYALLYHNIFKGSTCFRVKIKKISKKYIVFFLTIWYSMITEKINTDV